jgi:hypothetical protein
VTCSSFCALSQNSHREHTAQGSCGPAPVGHSIDALDTIAFLQFRLFTQPLYSYHLFLFLRRQSGSSLTHRPSHRSILAALLTAPSIHRKPLMSVPTTHPCTAPHTLTRRLSLARFRSVQVQRAQLESQETGYPVACRPPAIDARIDCPDAGFPGTRGKYRAVERDDSE